MLAGYFLDLYSLEASSVQDFCQFFRGEVVFIPSGFSYSKVTNQKHTTFFQDPSNLSESYLDVGYFVQGVYAHRSIKTPFGKFIHMLRIYMAAFNRVPPIICLRVYLLLNNTAIDINADGVRGKIPCQEPDQIAIAAPNIEDRANLPKRVYDL